MNDFFNPTPEEQIVVLIDADDPRKAEQLIVGCEACSEDAGIPFDNILDRHRMCTERDGLHHGETGEVSTVFSGDTGKDTD